MKITFNRYLLMLTLPLIAVLFTCTFYALCIGKTLPLNEELKASLKDYIDWDNSIHVIFESKNEVSKGMKI
jgi:sorbitol-specific phosphotransferase system component IIC